MLSEKRSFVRPLQDAVVLCHQEHAVVTGIGKHLKIRRTSAQLDDVVNVKRRLAQLAV